MTKPHVRNVGPMKASQRCGAKTRRGTPCLAPAVSECARCRMHGGKGSGAPAGNQNALKHGLYGREEREFRQKMRQLLRKGRELLEKH